MRQTIRNAHTSSLRTWGKTIAFSAMISCGGSPSRPATSAYTAEELNALAQHPPPEERRDGLPVPSPRPSIVTPANRPAELVRRDVPETVIAGTEVSFGIDVVDEEMNNVRVRLSRQPEGVEFDQRTMTVRWRVPRTMTGAQTFEVEVTENPSSERETTVTTAININVAPVGTRPTAPVAPVVSNGLINQLVTINRPEYLAATQRDWPIERVLEVARDALVDTVPAAEQTTITRRPGRELFRDLLGEYARLHNNPRLDPTSRQYDRRFDAARWRLVAVRPRLNKHIEELRLAYQATDVPEPVFVMFRFRLFRGAYPASPEIAQANNTNFTRLFHRAFFDGANVKPAIASGQAPAVNTAVSTFVRSILTFRDATNPALRVGLAAIPEEARMGGGSSFNAEGGYVSGNAWAFSVSNVALRPVAGGANNRREVRVVGVPISAFTFDITEAGDHFAARCPPRYTTGGEGSSPELVALCEPDGNVRIRETNAEGQVVATRRDSMTERTEITMREMLATVPLRDPRRRNFEENGMTCVQCHIRNFDDGVLSEAQVSNPQNHDAITPARVVDRVPMQILPTGRVARSPWFSQQETFQLCDVGRKIQSQLNVQTTLPCPEGY